MNGVYGITVNLDVFDDAINVFFGNKDLCIDHFVEQGCTGYNIEDIKRDIVDGFHMQSEEGDSFVYVGKDLKNKGVICHELMHAILTITHKRNIMCSDRPGEQELECYLVGHVMGEVLSTPKKKWFVRKDGEWKKQ